MEGLNLNKYGVEVNFELTDLKGLDDEESILKIIDKVRQGSITIPKIGLRITGYKRTQTTNGRKYTLIITPSDDIKMDEILNSIK